jgi:hypothetical protein
MHRLVCCLCLLAACGAPRDAGLAGASASAPLREQVLTISALAATGGGPAFNAGFHVDRELAPEVADLWAKRLDQHATLLARLGPADLGEERIAGDLGVIAVVTAPGRTEPFCLVRRGDRWLLLPYLTGYRDRLGTLSGDEQRALAGLLAWFRERHPAAP